MSRAKKIRDFAIGFFGWFAVNALIWFVLHTGPALALAPTQPGEDYMHMANRMYGFLFIAGLIVFPANILSLIVLAILRRWAALGMLAAIACNLVIALLAGAFVNGLCFIPFFDK